MGRDSTYEERLDNFRENLKKYAEDIERDKERLREQGLLNAMTCSIIAEYYSMLIALDAVILRIKGEDVDKVLKETIPKGILSGDDL